MGRLFAAWALLLAATCGHAEHVCTTPDCLQVGGDGPGTGATVAPGAITAAIYVVPHCRSAAWSW